MNCYCIVYTSEATVYLAEAALQLLLRQARAEHAQASITGLLLYSEGRFMQVLEGPAKEVREYFGRIAADPRHYRLQILADGPKPECDFTSWSMSFQCASPRACSEQANYRSLPQLLEITQATPMYHLLQDFLAEGMVPVL